MLAYQQKQLLTSASVAKATDENLTSENWEYIMDVCDKVTSEDSGAKDVVASMIKRLAHRNANVQLYTLEVRDFLLFVLCFLLMAFSSPMRSARIVVLRCTESLLRELSQMHSYD